MPDAFFKQLNAFGLAEIADAPVGARQLPPFLGSLRRARAVMRMQRSFNPVQHMASGVHADLFSHHCRNDCWGSGIRSRVSVQPDSIPGK